MPDIRLSVPAEGMTIVVVKGDKVLAVSTSEPIFGLDGALEQLTETVAKIVDQTTQRQERIHELPPVLCLQDIQCFYAGELRGRERNSALARSRRVMWSICTLLQDHVKRYCTACAQLPGVCQHNIYNQSGLKPLYRNEPGDWLFDIKDLAELTEAGLAACVPALRRQANLWPLIEHARGLVAAHQAA